MDSLLKEALALKEKVEAKAKAQIKNNRAALETIEKGLYRKVEEAMKTGDKSIIDEIHQKVEKFKKDQQEKTK